ncbi:MAG: hypothetical protein GF320_20740, partial [Armatimonadia bacterium]|nr:hypothetical protein [Armatimonadia bacterium]
MRHWFGAVLVMMLSAGAAWAGSEADAVEVPAPVIEEAHGDAAAATGHVAEALSELQGALVELRAALETLQRLRDEAYLPRLATEAEGALVITRKALEDVRADELRALAESVSEDVEVRVIQEQTEELADAAQFTVELDDGLVRLNGEGLTRLGVLGLGERCPTCGHPRLPQLEELEGLRILRQRVGEAGSEARVIIESEDLDEV